MSVSARGLRAGRALIELALTGDDKIQKALAGVQARASAIGSSFTRIGQIGMASAAAMAGAFAVTIRSASNLEETMNKFNVVFGDNSKVVKEWSDNFAKKVGRSQRQITDFMASSQDLFVPLGFDPGAATELSKQVTSLAIDLASFNNMSDADTQRDLQAALTGSGEVMKKYGVIVDEAAVKQELLNQSIDPKIATNQQKVQARLNIIMAGTTAAQGDAIRSAGAFANQMKKLQGKLEDTSATIGQAVLPLVTQLVTKTSSIVTAFADWAAKNQAVFLSLGKVVLSAAAASTGLVAMGSVLRATATLLAAVRTAAIGARIALTFLGKHPYLAAITAAITAATIATTALSAKFGEAAAPIATLAEKTSELEAIYKKLSGTMDEVGGKVDANDPFSGGDLLGRLDDAKASLKELRAIAATGDFSDILGGKESIDFQIAQREAQIAALQAALDRRLAAARGVSTPQAATPDAQAAKGTSTAVATGFIDGLRAASDLVARGVAAGNEALAAAMNDAMEVARERMQELEQHRDTAFAKADAFTQPEAFFDVRYIRQMLGGPQDEMLAETRRIRKAVENPKGAGVPVV